mgnify:FL=1
MSLPEVVPAADADLVTYRQWNRSMLSHPRLAVATVVDALLARIESDTAKLKALEGTLEERDEQIARLKADNCDCYRVHDDFCTIPREKRHD